MGCVDGTNLRTEKGSIINWTSRRALQLSTPRNGRCVRTRITARNDSKVYDAVHTCISTSAGIGVDMTMCVLCVRMHIMQRSLMQFVMIGTRNLWQVRRAGSKFVKLLH